MGKKGTTKAKFVGDMGKSLALAQNSLPQPEAQVRNHVFVEIKSKHNCKCNYREKL